MSMNWADSSDDEDENYFAPENNPPVPNDEPSQDDDYDDHEGDEPPASGRARKDFILPEYPPYTAFIGNLAFSVKDPQELADKISQLVKTRFGEDIVITAQRVAIDWKDNNKHKGFGYVEVETLEHLKSVLKLDDGQSIIAGRTIHLDVAQGSSATVKRKSSRSTSFGAGGGGATEENQNSDGAKFQSGRYNNRQGSSGSFRRQDSSASNNQNTNSERSTGSFRRKESSGSLRRSESITGPTPLVGGERPTLKLQPRSRTEGSVQSSTGTNANIFGGAKPRDEESWERGRNTTTGGVAAATPASTGEIRKPRNNNNTGRPAPAAGRDGNTKEGSGRSNGGDGGGSGGGGGRTGGAARVRNDRKPARQTSTGSTGRAGNAKIDSKKELDAKKSDQSKANPIPLPTAVVADKAVGDKKVINKFAALDFGDSDEE